MALFDSFSISSSGMTANRLWLDLITNNIVNQNTPGRPGDPELQPYKRQAPVFSEYLKASTLSGKFNYKGLGVQVSKVMKDTSQPRLVYEPANPLADENGYVGYPNINIANEMVDMISATRAYDASATAFNAAKGMALKALEIGRGF